MATASWITVNVFRPRMSIFSIPTCSSPTMSYCVMIASGTWGAMQTGTYSVSGPGAITMPAACTEACRASPSMREPRSSTLRTRSSCSAAARSSGTFSAASARLSE